MRTNTDITTDTKTEVSTATAAAAAKTAQPQFRTFYCLSDQVVYLEQDYDIVPAFKSSCGWQRIALPQNSVLRSFPFKTAILTPSESTLDNQLTIKTYSTVPWFGYSYTMEKKKISEHPVFELQLTETDCFFLNIKFDSKDKIDAKDEKYTVDAKLLSPISAKLKTATIEYTQPNLEDSFKARKDTEKELQQLWETSSGKIYHKLIVLILHLQKKNLIERERNLVNEIQSELIKIASQSNSITELINLFDKYHQQRERAERPRLSWIFSPSYHSIHYQAFLYVASFNLNAHLKFSDFQTTLGSHIPVTPLIEIIEGYLFFSPASFRKHKLNDPSKKPQPPQKIMQPIDEKSATAAQPTTASSCKRKFNDLSNQSEPPLKITKASDEEPAPAAVLRS